MLCGSNDYNGIISPISTVSHGTTVVRGNFVGFNASSKRAYVRRFLTSEVENPQDLELEYDILIICTGAKYSDPIRVTNFGITASDRIDQITKYYELLKSAKSVIVAGGGLVGVEMIAEIAARMPGKKLSLVSRDSLLSTLPPKAGEHALRWLVRHGVDVRLGAAVQSCGPRSLRLLSGEILQADVVIDCTNRGVDPAPSSDSLAEGTVVLFRDPNRHRNNERASWRLGKLIGRPNGSEEDTNSRSEVSIKALGAESTSEHTYEIRNNPNNICVLNSQTRVAREVVIIDLLS